MRKQLLLTVLVCLSVTPRKKRDGIEKTDVTNIVVNTDDILRTYFRKRTGHYNNARKKKCNLG